MCEHFSCVYTQDDRLFWCETDSHHDIVSRARISQRQNVLAARAYVKLECLPPYTSLNIDEESTLPGWFSDIKHDPVAWEALTLRVADLARKVDKILLWTNKVAYRLENMRKAATKPIWTAYRNSCQQIEDRRKAELDVIHEAQRTINAQYPTLCAERSLALKPGLDRIREIQTAASKQESALLHEAHRQSEDLSKPYIAMEIEIDNRMFERYAKLPGYVAKTIPFAVFNRYPIPIP